MSSRAEEMWYCPHCGLWIGWELERCVSDGHDRPRWEIRQGDVSGFGRPAAVPATRVAQAGPLQRWYWKLRGRLREARNGS